MVGQVFLAFLPLLRLKITPYHLAIDGLVVVAEPSFELVVGRHV